MRRVPSSRFNSLQLDHGGTEPSACSLWTAATMLGVIVFFGRVTEVFFLGCWLLDRAGGKWLWDMACHVGLVFLHCLVKFTVRNRDIWE